MTCTGPFPILKVLDLDGCSSLNGALDVISNLSQLKVLQSSGCESSMELPFTGPLVELEELDLSGC